MINVFQFFQSLTQRPLVSEEKTGMLVTVCLMLTTYDAGWRWEEVSLIDFCHTVGRKTELLVFSRSANQLPFYDIKHLYYNANS